MKRQELDDLLKMIKGNKKLICDSYPNREIWYFKTGWDVFQGETAIEAVAQAILFEKKMPIVEATTNLQNKSSG